MKLKESWDNLNPNIKRGLVIGGAVGGILLLAWFSDTVEPPKLTDFQKSEKIHRLLTDTDPRSVSLDALAERVHSLENTSRETSTKLDRLMDEIKRIQQSDEIKFQQWTQTERSRYEQNLKDLERKLQQISAKAAQLPVSESSPQTIELPEAPDSRQEEEFQKPKLRPWSPGGHEPVEAIAPRQAPSISSGQPANLAQAALSIRSIVNEPEAQPVAAAKQDTPPAMQIPAGSILSGVLINGLDAPTSQRSRQDPQPVLVRIKHEAILPNRYRSDIRECFLIASGYGDMSSERAFLRSETLACVRSDRKVLERQIKSYAVGEDGKVGIRGRLVSKQGRVLANAMLAGFAKGISQIFGRQQVPVVVTDFRNQAPFQSILTPEAAQAAAIRGVGESLETLTKFYLDMAQNLFPVIEVDAGRKVEFIVNKGLEL